jgi:hypothetical protein
MCYVLFSYACFLVGQGFICRYIFMAMYSSVPPFREVKFCGVPPCVSDKLGCAADGKILRNTVLVYMASQPKTTTSSSSPPLKPRISTWVCHFLDLKWSVDRLLYRTQHTQNVLVLRFPDCINLHCFRKGSAWEGVGVTWRHCLPVVSLS